MSTSQESITGNVSMGKHIDLDERHCIHWTVGRTMNSETDWPCAMLRHIECDQCTEGAILLRGDIDPRVWGWNGSFDKPTFTHCMKGKCGDSGYIVEGQWISVERIP